MKKDKLMGKIFGIALVFVMIALMPGGLPSTTSIIEASPASENEYPIIAPGELGYNDARKLARSSDGALHCVYSRSDGQYSQIYHSYSSNGGITWTEEQITTGSHNYLNPCIAIGSNDYIHVAWYYCGSGTWNNVCTVQYREKTTTWQPIEDIIAGYHQSPSIAVDSNDNVHCIVGGSNPGGYNCDYAVYLKRTSSGWSSPEKVSSTCWAGSPPGIAVDKNGNVHVVYSYAPRYGAHYGLRYRERTASGWQNEEVIQTDDLVWSYGSMAIDSSGNIYVVYYFVESGTGNPGPIKLSKRTSSGWQPAEDICPASKYPQTNPAIAIDGNDYLHVVWQGKNSDSPDHYQIMYKKYTTGWSTIQNLTSASVDRENPNLIWACWPIVDGLATNRPKQGYAFVWNDASDIRFYESSDLEWEGELDTTPPIVDNFYTDRTTIVVGETIRFDYSVSDTGGSGLKQVELWRANDSGGSPGTWAQITTRTISGNSYSGSFSDTPSSSGSYWYGIHAVDNANNWAPEASPVKVEIKPANTGKIIVTTNLDNAKFMITGPKSYSGSGNTWIVFEAPIGSYTIIYEEVNGYTAPLRETKALISGGKIVFSGEYVKQTENVAQPLDLLTFFTHVLEQLGIPHNGFALNALQIWAKYEDTNAQYNPLATTMPTHKPGETNFNSAGVKNYPDMETGIDVTAKTIHLSYYTPIREMLALKSFDEEGIKKAVATWSGLTESAQYVQDLVNEWKESFATYQRLSDRITTWMNDKTPYPEYFWVPFKQAEYDELYQAGIDFDILARSALIQAYCFLNRGDFGNAQKYFDRFLALWPTAYKYFGAAAEFAAGYYEDAETIVRVIYEADKFAAKMVAIAAGPKAVTIINALYHGLDGYIDWKTSGWTEAAKNLVIDVALDAIVCKVEFDELGGRTIKNFLENRVGKITFPLIQEMLSENKQAIVSKIVKEGSLYGMVEFSKYTGEQLNELFDQIIDGLAERLIEQQQQIQLKSPGELRVYDSTGNVTGLINGSVKNQIPRSLYEDGSVTIFFPTDSYQYEVAGTDDGTYGMMVTSVDGENVSTFTLVDVPISRNTTHLYIPEWDNSTGTVSEVTMKIDSNGDGVFEKTVPLSATGETKEFPWVWIVVVAIVFVAYVVLRRVIKMKR